MDLKTFLSQFTFDPSLEGAIGVEREFFLVDDRGMPVPRSPEFLKYVADSAWTYELSACQVEHRTKPERRLSQIFRYLALAHAQGIAAAEAMGLRLAVMEVGPEDMPLVVYPHDERYRSIVSTLPSATLSAACRVTGTHLHRGVSNIEQAIAAHNKVVRHLDEFVAMGDHSGGERLRLYKAMAKNWKPPQYESPEHFHAVARQQGFEENPRNCWHLVRISRHGTVELRMFGMTENPAEIVQWITFLRQVLGGK